MVTGHYRHHPPSYRDHTEVFFVVKFFHLCQSPPRQRGTSGLFTQSASIRVNQRLVRSFQFVPTLRCGNATEGRRGIKAAVIKFQPLPFRHPSEIPYFNGGDGAVYNRHQFSCGKGLRCVAIDNPGGYVYGKHVAVGGDEV